MKKQLLIMVLALVLCGCSTEQTFETVTDELVLAASAQPRKILLTLPEETLMPAMETENGTLYLCDGYDIIVQTLESGDLDATVRQISGFSKAELTIIQTIAGEYPCYEFVWSAATDLGQQVGRAMILEDADYHYAICAVSPEKDAEEYQQIWNGIFDSVTIV